MAESEQSKLSKRIVCSKCSFDNRPGIIFCEQCGTQLIDVKPATDTRVMPNHLADQFQNLDESGKYETMFVRSSKDVGHLTGTSVFQPEMTLQLQPEMREDGATLTTPEPILLNPEERTPIMFGRKDEKHGHYPDVDLLEYGGQQQGISRTHLEVIRTGKRIDIVDMGSSNGTFLNGVKLDAHEAHQIRDNDRLRLGKLVLLVTFQTAKA